MTIDEFKKNIAPYMKKGYVAMDKDKNWLWSSRKLKIYLNEGCWGNNVFSCKFINLSHIFNIKPVKDWTKSLIEVGK